MSGTDAQASGRVVVGRYRLERVLGRGGMGVVWLAVDTLIERRVALKELRAPAGVVEADEGSFVERALREARNAGRLSHPGVVAVHNVIAPTGDDPSVYIVMEYVEAPTLGDLIDQQGALPPPRVAAMGLGILDALMAAHAMGIVHRDIKPSNVLVRDGDRVKLTDFGIALAAEDTRLTRSGVMGTHDYLAPEAFDAGQVGPAADLWALGATLFHAVAGRAPFERETTTATLRAILFEDPPAPPCPPPLSDVITGLLTRPADHRLTGDAAREKLEQAAAQPLSPPPTTNAPPSGAWDARTTTVHRSPTHPGGRPAPPAPGLPAGFAQPGSGPGVPPQPGPATGPISAGPWAGSPSQRSSSNSTPLVIGGVAAAVAVLLIVVIIAASGGSDSGGNGGGSTTTAAADRATAADAAVTANAFLGAIRDGNEEAATEMMCSPDDSWAPYIGSAIAGNADVFIGETLVENDSSFEARLVGDVNGEAIVSGSLEAENDADTGWCISFFSAF